MNISETITYKQRVGRVLRFPQVGGIGTPPTPRPQANVPPPPFWGEGHTLWQERGWESPNSDEGTYNVVIFIYTNLVPTNETVVRRIWKSSLNKRYLRQISRLKTTIESWNRGHVFRLGFWMKPRILASSKKSQLMRDSMMKSPL